MYVNVYNGVAECTGARQAIKITPRLSETSPNLSSYSFLSVSGVMRSFQTFQRFKITNFLLLVRPCGGRGEDEQRC